MFEKEGFYGSCNGCIGHRGKQFYEEELGDNSPCEDCLGTGLPLTEIGKELVKFLKDHYGLELKR